MASPSTLGPPSRRAGRQPDRPPADVRDPPGYAVIYYAAHATGTRTRSAIRAAGLGMLGSAAYRWMDTEWSTLASGGLGWALDNGAWSAFRAGTPFNGEQFRHMALHCGPVDFIVCPDVVMDWPDTVAMRREWLGWLLSETPHRVLLPLSLIHI
jgi:hypothetical protein